MKNGKLRNDNAAFSGIEAAIILIAFIIVASVFSYVLVGAGFFTASQTKSAVYSGMSQVGASVQVDGNVIGLSDDAKGGENFDAHINGIKFWIENTAGGSGADMMDMVITFNSRDDYYTIDPAGKKWKAIYKEGKDAGAGEWCVSAIKHGTDGNDDNMLQHGEKMLISLKLDGKGVGTNDPFTIELKGGGAEWPIHLRAPGKIYPVNELH
jgi:flagellin FlaB